MQIRVATGNIANPMAKRSVQRSRPLMPHGNHRFGAECKVTISQEGRNLSRQQLAHTEKGSQDVRAEKMLLRQQEQEDQNQKIKDRYREELKEIENTISSLNNSYDKIEDEFTKDKKVKVLKAMRVQKQLQMEENQRQAKEAQQMAMQFSKYQEDIDENNRDMLTLLKSLEAAEDSEDTRRNGESGGKDSNIDMSDSTNSTSDRIHNSALQFTLSSVQREWGVEEVIAGLGEEGHQFLDAANSITKSILEESKVVTAALDDEFLPDEKKAEMMEALQDGMAFNYDAVKHYRGWGLQMRQDAQDCKINHIADNPLGGVQDTKKSMMLSAVDAVYHDAVQGKLGDTSSKIKDEIEKLIDERNDVDKTQPEKEEDEQEEEFIV